MPDRRFTWILITLAVVVRAAAVLGLQSHTLPHSTYEHGEIAANLLAGRGFSVKFLGAEGPTSQQAPVYPLIVAGAYALGGVETPRALLILELGQAILGGMLVMGVLRLAREVAPGSHWVARGAGVIAALHPTLVYSATHVQVAGLAATLMTFSLAAAYRTGRAGSLRGTFKTGLWLTFLTLTDPILGLSMVGACWAVALSRSVAPFSPSCEGGAGGGDPGPIHRAKVITPPNPPFARGGKDLSPQIPVRATVKSIAIIGLTLALGLLPWTVRNYRVHGEFVAVKSTFGYAFWQGNSALSEGTDKVVRASVEKALRLPGSSFDPRTLNAALWKARHEAGYLDDIALSRADYRILGGVSEPERSRILFRKAIIDLRADPLRYPRLCLRRLRYFFLFDETNPKTRNALYRVSHLGSSILAVLGLSLAGPSLRRRLVPTFVTVALIACFHALTIVSVRFHVPIEPLLAVWAGCGLARVSAARSHDVERVGVVYRLHHRPAAANVRD